MYSTRIKSIVKVTESTCGDTQHLIRNRIVRFVSKSKSFRTTPSTKITNGHSHEIDCCPLHNGRQLLLLLGNYFLVLVVKVRHSSSHSPHCTCMERRTRLVTKREQLLFSQTHMMTVVSKVKDHLIYGVSISIIDRNCNGSRFFMIDYFYGVTRL